MVIKKFVCPRTHFGINGNKTTNFCHRELQRTNQIEREKNNNQMALNAFTCQLDCLIDEFEWKKRFFSLFHLFSFPIITTIHGFHFETILFANSIFFIRFFHSNTEITTQFK